jgi:hypothetical protein
MGGGATSVGASRLVGAVTSAGVDAGSGSAGTNGAPQLPQKLEPACSSLPQLAQVSIVVLLKRLAAYSRAAVERKLMQMRAFVPPLGQQRWSLHGRSTPPPGCQTQRQPPQ